MPVQVLFSVRAIPAALRFSTPRQPTAVTTSAVIRFTSPPPITVTAPTPRTAVQAAVRLFIPAASLVLLTVLIAEISRGPILVDKPLADPACWLVVVA